MIAALIALLCLLSWRAQRARQTWYRTRHPVKSLRRRYKRAANPKATVLRKASFKRTTGVSRGLRAMRIKL